MRFALMALLVLLSPIVATVQITSPRNPKESTPTVELRLIPEKTAIRPGETLKLRAEIWNIGADDIIIAQNVDATYGNSVLSLYLEAGSKSESSPGNIGDSIPEKNPDFEKTFVTNWLTLNRGHYYGTYVYMDPIELPMLRKSGHYKVRAEYYSRGITSIPGWNGGYLKQEDVERLPLKDLKGTVTSNIVKIQVLPAKKTTGK